MAADIPDTEPTSARAGDTWRWTRTLDDYAASDGWTLKYRFKSPAAGFEVTATTAGAGWSITVAATTTAAMTAGTYAWMAWLEGGSSEKYTVDTGTLVVDPDYRSGTATAAFDDRSHARKTLDAIEAWIEARDAGVAEYEIAGRRMRYIPVADLLKLRQYYKAEVNAEEAQEKIANGLGVPRKIQFRL